MADREGDPLQAVQALREDTNIPEAAAFLNDNPVVDTIDRLARGRRERQSGFETVTYHNARRDAGLPDERPTYNATVTGEPHSVAYKRDSTPETEPTPAQRVFDAFSAFHPTESGAAEPTPTDRQMASAILRAPAAGKVIDRLIEANAAPEDRTQRKGPR